MSTDRDDVASVNERRRALQTLASATALELSKAIETHWADHGARDLKPVECGLVMLRGRIGGDGPPFNVGEATVTRAVVQLPTGQRGFGHVLGRDQGKARCVAILDAMFQRPEEVERVKRSALAPVEARLVRERAAMAAATAATRVEFFTLVRGEA